MHQPETMLRAERMRTLGDLGTLILGVHRVPAFLKHQWRLQNNCCDHLQASRCVLMHSSATCQIICTRADLHSMQLNDI